MNSTPFDESGFVYIMINSAMPELIKIGLTKRDPEQRARDLSTTGVPGRWIVNYKLWVTDCRWVEWSTHRYFSSSRIDNSREFFRVDPATAQSVIKRFSEMLSSLQEAGQSSFVDIQNSSPAGDYHINPEHAGNDDSSNKKAEEVEAEALKRQRRKENIRREKKDSEVRDKSQLSGFKTVMNFRKQCPGCMHYFSVTLARYEQGTRCASCNLYFPIDVQW